MQPAGTGMGGPACPHPPQHPRDQGDLTHPFCTAARGSLLLRTHTMSTAKRQKKAAMAKPMRYTALWPRKLLQSTLVWTPSTEPLPSQNPGS